MYSVHFEGRLPLFLGYNFIEVVGSRSVLFLRLLDRVFLFYFILVMLEYTLGMWKCWYQFVAL